MIGVRFSSGQTKIATITWWFWGKILACECKGDLLLGQVWVLFKFAAVILCCSITGSVLKVKRQDNLTNFMLDDNETIVSVTTGMKT